MSNKTDGKKALEEGDFSLAEKKLLKALEFHSDDSELWWAMMLCKSGLKNDAELTKSVREDFECAAKAGGPPPDTPFDTHYCRNALRYATDGRRRNYIKKLYAELSDVWFAARGKKLTAPIPREKKLPDIAKILMIIEYLSIALIAAGVWLVCFALLTFTVWALWTGFAVLVVFALASFILIRIMKKYGCNTENPSVAQFTVIVLSALALLIVGIVRGYQMIVVMASVVLAIAAAIGLYRLFARKKPSEKTSGAVKKSQRDPYELSARTKKIKKANSSDKPLSKGDRDEYKDDYD